MARPIERLPERQDILVFKHKASEINYGGNMRFQQAAFPPVSNRQDHIEVLVYEMIDRFAQLVEQRQPSEQQVIQGTDEELEKIFHELWCAMPQVNYQAFQNWYRLTVIPVAEMTQKITLHALKQEKELKIENLQYLACLSTMELIAQMISDYFEKHIYRLGRLSTVARWIIARAIILALKNSELQSTQESLAQTSPSGLEVQQAQQRLLNPFVLAFADAGDAGLIEEVLISINPYRAPLTLQKRMQKIVARLVVESKQFEAINLQRTLAEPVAWQKLMQHAGMRKRILKELRRDDTLRSYLVIENVKHEWQSMMRRSIRQKNIPPALLNLINNDKQLSELLTRSSKRAQLFKTIKKINPSSQEAIKKVFKRGLNLVKKCRRRRWGRLTNQELLEELSVFQDRLLGLLSAAEDFKLIRKHYGHNTNQGAKWLKLKLWRSYTMVVNQLAKNDQERYQLVDDWEKRQVDVENSFAEGNIFFVRPLGVMYARGSQRRNNVIFMFADLRNSTETTMKLTKDTASYLTPYLTAVNSSAKRCQGHRIYFAGDGFAAYFSKISDAVRASYLINLQFSKLKKVSSEETIKKAKDIYREATKLVPTLQEPECVRTFLADHENVTNEEVHSFLVSLSRYNAEKLEETVVKLLLVKTAEEYSMPRIDAGVALTTGELFNAMVGEDGEDKIPIVISPQLTQAARLSGSSDLVKQYIDTHFPHPFPYNAYAWDQKLYNRGIVLTKQVMVELRQDMGVFPLTTSQSPFDQEKLFYYEDEAIKRRIILRESQEAVKLKGIDEPCAIYEVAPPGSSLDKAFGKLEKELV